MTDTTRPPLPDPTGLEDRLSPVDIPGDAPDEGAPRWTVQIVALATALLFLLNATAIRAWANELAPSAWTEPVIAAADAWHGFASGLGLAAPVETMHGWWEGARAARFGGGEAAAPPPDVEEEPAQRQPRPGERALPTT